MRVLRLDLFAYGPFSNARLDFSAKPAALQLVYGLNEAGKSTTLRALLALLYGIPARTSDAHHHEMGRLRIGAQLQDDKGHTLQVVRRKGLKQTLLDSEGQPLPDGTLSELMGGLDEALFRNMFGLDHDRLREGAEALLKGGGNLGEGLFDASVGSRALREVKEALSLEADELYKARGKTPKLNLALEALRERSRRKKEAALSPTAFVEQTRGLAQKQEQRADVLARRRELLAEKARLARELQLLPLLSRHEVLSSALAELSVQRADAGRPAVGSDLLEEQIRDLERRYGVLLSSEADLPQLRSELAALERELSAARLRIGATSLPERPIDTPLRTRLRKLASEHTRAAERSAALTETLSSLALELQLLRERITQQQPGAASDWLSAILTSIERDDIVASLSRGQAELARRGTSLERAIAQLGLDFSVTELSQVVLPEERALLELERNDDGFDAELTRHRARCTSIDERVRTLSLTRGALLADGSLASPVELAEARSQRGQHFELLASALLTGASLDNPPRQVDQFRASLVHTDQLADRMRREASRASELNGVQAELTMLEAEASELAARIASLQVQKSELLQVLTTLLAPCRMLPDAPRTLRPRLVKLQALREQAVALQADAAAHTQLAAHATQLADQLRSGLLAQAPELSVPHVLPLPHAISLARSWFLRLQEQTRAAEQLHEKSRELQTREATLRHQQQAAQAECAALALRFAEELLRAGLDTVLAPDELLACLDDIGLSFELTRKIDALRTRQEALSINAASLAEDVAQLVARHVPTAAAASLAEQLELLSRKHRHERESERDHTRLKLELDQLSDELTRLGDGESLSALQQRKSGVDPSLLRARLFEIDTSLTTLEDELSALEQELGGLSAGLATLNRSPYAVGLAEEVEADLASVRGLLRRYLEVKLSLSILSREVERYRREHQGPLLSRASELFSRLTLRNYTGLEADLDEHDQPVLCALHKSQKRVRIGGLSDGTRDQLYLALRVASLEQYIAGGRALPLVLDDAFIHFDDKRAEAALAVLGELSTRTQVLFFTHHARMIELAKRALKPAQVALHELDPVRGTVNFRDDGPLFARL